MLDNTFQVRPGTPLETCACGARICRVRDGNETVVVTYERGKPLDAFHARHDCAMTAEAASTREEARKEAGRQMSA